MVDNIFRNESFKIAFADAATTGYVVECGVGGGGSLRTLVKFAQPKQLVFGFDSFKGLPEDWKMNEDYTWPAGSFSWDMPNIPGAELRAGWFADTLPVWKKEHSGRIALLHIDSDLYSSCVTLLEELNDQIHTGTVIVSDDHFYKPHYDGGGRLSHEYVYWDQGHHKAFEEWKKKHNRKIHLLSHGILGQAVFRVIQ